MLKHQQENFPYGVKGFVSMLFRRMKILASVFGCPVVSFS